MKVARSPGGGSWRVEPDQVVKPWWSVVQGSEFTTAEHGGVGETEGERGRERSEKEKRERSEKEREEERREIGKGATGSGLGASEQRLSVPSNFKGWADGVGPAREGNALPSTTPTYLSFQNLRTCLIIEF